MLGVHAGDACWGCMLAGPDSSYLESLNLGGRDRSFSVSSRDQPDLHSVPSKFQDYIERQRWRGKGGGASSKIFLIPQEESEDGREMPELWEQVQSGSVRRVKDGFSNLGAR